MNWTNEDSRKSISPAAITWVEMCRIEPKLIKFYTFIRTQCPNGWSNEDWSGWIKPALTTLVGWDAETSDLRLRTPEAWETAFFELSLIGG